jgi:hypothetical protein
MWTELKKINSYYSPHDKLECVWRCCQIVSSTASLPSTSSSESHRACVADVILPMRVTHIDLLKLSSRKSDAVYFKLLVYVIVQTNPPRLLSNTAYIENFSSPEELNSEPGS